MIGARVKAKQIPVVPLDLSLRKKAPSVGWQSLPETLMAEKLRAAGEQDIFIRLSSTFLAVMDRARDANQLWERGLRLYRIARWALTSTKW